MTLWIMWKRHQARVLSKHTGNEVVACVYNGVVGRFTAGKEVR